MGKEEGDGEGGCKGAAGRGAGQFVGFSLHRWYNEGSGLAYEFFGARDDKLMPE
jgi:hypothetical protein